MDKELKYFLQQGPTTVKELARLTGKSTSTLYKALKADGVINEDGKFSMAPEEAPTPAAPATSTASPEQPAKVAPAASKRGRKATAAGQRLTAVGTDNPRRQNSHGHRSLQVIIDNPGITTEDYLAQGGRLNDLRWDIAHGSVKAE